MKNKSNTSTRKGFNKNHGFTLTEVMIVGAILAVLASAAIAFGPDLIRKSKVRTTTNVISSAKGAVSTFLSYEENSRLPLTAGSAILGNTTAVADMAALSRAARLDDVLLATKIIDKPFSFPISTAEAPGESTVGVVWDATAKQFTTAAAPTRNYDASYRLECTLSAPGSDPSTAFGANFRLDGVQNEKAGRRIISFIAPRVTAEAAHELSKSLDGATLSQADATTADDRGMIAYSAPDAEGLVTVFAYLGTQ